MAYHRTNVALPTSSCLLGITQHGLFRTDLQRSGPHAIVAGTTGSGKSELLISWCLSLAMQYSPDDLHFVFLDFKGDRHSTPWNSFHTRLATFAILTCPMRSVH
ncbi:MAG: FtsK/SpoIIIE domain-containing protein [Bifidobacterium pseudocatenulatum]